MGFLKHLLFWPVTGPMYLAEFSMEKVRGVVKEQLTDQDRVKEALMDLQLSLELGEIDEDEYVREETRLMEQLREVRRWREEFGMGTRGGVVQMDGGEPGEPGAPGDATRPGEGERGDAPDAGERPVIAGGGASLEVTLDWETDDDSGDDEGPDAGDSAEEDETWTDGSSHGSGPGSSSS